MQGKEGHADLLDRSADCGTRLAQNHYHGKATFRSGRRRACRSDWTAAASRRRISSGARLTVQRLGWARDRHHLFWRNADGVPARNHPASNFAAPHGFWHCAIRRWRRWVDPCRICRSSLCAALSRAARTWAASCQPQRRGPHNFLANMDLFRAGLFDRRRRVRCGRASRLCLVFVRASLRASLSQ
jgi:hypothetical protein